MSNSTAADTAMLIQNNALFLLQQAQFRQIGLIDDSLLQNSNSDILRPISTTTLGSQRSQDSESSSRHSPYTIESILKPGEMATQLQMFQANIKQQNIENDATPPPQLDEETTTIWWVLQKVVKKQFKKCSWVGCVEGRMEWSS